MRIFIEGCLATLLALAPVPHHPDVAGAADKEGAGLIRPAQHRQTLTGPSQEVGTAWAAGEHRQFDFWVGEWNVNLRILQDDNSWKDSRSARAKIYLILDGRAIFELWDETTPDDGIRGYSLRFFDPAKKKWQLFLNWPGRNRSGTSTLNGSFRHGRGEFFSARTGAADGETISRYTFSDISPNRLRWDDGFSTDGGRTWRGNWIMEFSRAGDRATWPEDGEAAHTFYTGERCDRPEFREFERLEGVFHGEIRLLDPSGAERVGTARLVGYRILDGCAVMTFLEYVAGGRVHKIFSLKTYNTYLDLFEETRLDNQPGTPMLMLYGGREDETLRLRTKRGIQPSLRHTWEFPADGKAVLNVEQQAGNAAWQPRAAIELTRDDRP
jgi:hypothetical protein